LVLNPGLEVMAVSLAALARGATDQMGGNVAPRVRTVLADKVRNRFVLVCSEPTLDKPLAKAASVHRGFKGVGGAGGRKGGKIEGFGGRKRDKSTGKRWVSEREGKRRKKWMSKRF
jgi:hypothetical protein